jgi:cell division protein FtsQ
MNKMVRILKWGVLLGYFPVMLAFISVSHQSVVCSDVNVIVRDSAYARFVSAEDIRSSILDAYPDLLGGAVTQVNFDEMEAFVKEHSAIRSAEVYNSGSGVLNVMVTQHEPIVRVFAAEGTYYLDESGRQLPVSSHFSAHVLVVSGTIPKDRSDLIKLAGIIVNDPFWTAQMEQIYIRRNNEYILVPRVGDHLILLGQPDDVGKKLRNLKIVYTSGLDPKEWNDYQVINLKYKNQVICSRNRSL